jgi:hypothetical protein
VWLFKTSINTREDKKTTDGWYKKLPLKNITIKIRAKKHFKLDSLILGKYVLSMSR